MQASYPESLKRIQTAQLELLNTFGNTLLRSATLLAPIALEALRSNVGEAATLANSLPAAKTPQDVATLQNDFAQRMMGSLSAAARSAYQISMDTQATLNQLIEGHVNDIQATVEQSVTEAGRNSPIPLTSLVDAMKHFNTIGNDAWQAANKSVRQTMDAGAARAEEAASTVAGTASTRKARQAA